MSNIHYYQIKKRRHQKSSSVIPGSIDIDPPDEPVMLEEGTALGMGDGFGPDLGDATSAFGTSQPSGSTLVGTFYDTKQTPGGRPTNMTMDQYRAFLSRFVNKGWNESELNRFYKAPQQLRLM